jgi:DNA-binding GntR family transcriptional regulator
LREEQIYQILRNAIFNAELTPGMQLVESSLAEAFGVSRTPVRSVLQRLNYESLVQIIPNRGAFVYCPSPEEAEHIFRVRQVLEPEAAYLAATHATAYDLDKMANLLEQETRWYKENQPHQVLRTIESFHLALVDASRNPYLIRYLREIISLAHLIFTFYDVADNDASHDHQAIYEAVRLGDAKRARDLAHVHIPPMIRDIDFSKPLKGALSIDQIINRYTT